MRADKEFIAQLTKRIHEIIKKCEDEEMNKKLNELLDDIIYSQKI